MLKRPLMRACHRLQKIRLSKESMTAGAEVGTLASQSRDAPSLWSSSGLADPFYFSWAAFTETSAQRLRVSERGASYSGGLAERHGIRIVFMGAANPDGIARGTRSNARDIDLNRNFATENFGLGAGQGVIRLCPSPNHGSCKRSLILWPPRRSLPFTVVYPPWITTDHLFNWPPLWRMRARGRALPHRKARF